jgi:GTP cyclohydrolase I
MYKLALTEEAAITLHPHPMGACSSLSKEEKITAIASHFRKIMEILDLDLTNASLKNTPERLARMYIEDLFWGLDPTAFPDISYLDNHIFDANEGMILIKDIPIKSICEHHFVPFTGKAKIAYIPTDKILGLSKIHRIVDYFCRRPQLQERLTAQIADSLSILLHSNDVAVVLEAEHFCVKIRGIEHSGSSTQTLVMRGRFKDDAALSKNVTSD